MVNTSQILPFPVDCVGGLVLNKSTFSMPSGTALQLQNYEPDISGGYRRINGFAQFSATAVPGTGKIRGLSIFNDTVIACRDEYVVYGTGTTWTTITSARNISTERYHFDAFNFDGTDKLIMISEDDFGATWDGSTYTLMNGALGSGSGTAPTAPTAVRAYQNHMFYAQDNILTFSAPFDENNFTPASGSGQIVIPEIIREIKLFRDALVVFCANSIYKVVGTSLSDFSMKHIADDIGTVAGYSVQEIAGDLVFLSPDGIRTIAGTERIDDTELGTVSSNIQSLVNNFTGSEHVTSLVIRNKNQYRVFYPLDGTAEASALGVISVLKDNAEWEFSQTVGIKPSYATSGYYNGDELVIHGGYSDGIVYQQETGNDFNGAAINALFRSPDHAITDIGEDKIIHRVLLEIDNEGTLTTDFYILYDGENVATPQPAPYTITATGGKSVYGTAVYGTDIYDSGSTIALRQAVEGSGFTVAVKFKESASSAPYIIRGYQIEYEIGGRR